MDRYPYSVPVKGGYETFLSKFIFITSNSMINDWYKFKNFKTDAIIRRLTMYFYVWSENKTKDLL